MTRITITIDRELLARLDRAIAQGRFSDRNRAVQEALLHKLGRLDRGRLARECAKLDCEVEQQMAEEGAAVDVQEWGAY